MSQEIKQSIDKELKKRIDKNLFRTLRTHSGVDFCSNDYLGLANHPNLKKSLIVGIEKYGCGSTASRLVRGHYKVVEDFELEFSQFVESTSSIFVANGFTANLGLLDTLADSRTIIFTDRLNHASILDGIRISGATRVYHRHLDVEHLKSNLEKYKDYPKKIIVSETIFSMDGDIVPIQELVELKIDYDTILILDETHAVGVFGDRGAGLTHDSEKLDNSLRNEIDFRIFTMGKAFGLEGGVISMNQSMYKDYLVNCMRNFVFSTAPMPSLAHAGIDSIQIVQSMDEDRKRIFKHSEKIRNTCSELGLSYGDSESQILPIILGSERIALDWASYLQELGIDVRAIRPPTVETARLRLSVHSHHSEHEISMLLSGIQALARVNQGN